MMPHGVVCICYSMWNRIPKENDIRNHCHIGLELPKCNCSEMKRGLKLGIASCFCTFLLSTHLQNKTVVCHVLFHIVVCYMLLQNKRTYINLFCLGLGF
jgi:hypothetical protein